MAGDPMDYCAACRGEVYPEATRCRHCGLRFDPWWRTTAGQVVFLAALVLLVVGGLIGVNRAVDRSEDKAEDCVETVMAGGDC